MLRRCLWLMGLLTAGVVGILIILASPRPNEPRFLKAIRTKYMWAEYLALLGYGLRQPRLWTYRASHAERSQPLSGDRLVPAANASATYGATIQAPPEQIWPWLLQMGEGRALWYCWSPCHAYPEFKHHISPYELHPEWQHLAVGDVLLDADALGQCNANRGAWRVRVMQHDRALVFFSARDLIDGFEFDPAGPRPERVYAITSWGFYIEPVEAGESRLLIRTRAELGPGWPNWLLARVVIGCADAVFERTILDGIKQRVERRGPAAGWAHERATADLRRQSISSQVKECQR
jgi:proline iminopeptidase